MKRTISLLTLSLLISFSANCFAAGTLVVEAVDNDKIYEGESLSNPLPKGCLAQVILDRDGDGLDPINLSGSIYPAGDDVLLPVLSGSSTCMIGDGLPPFAPEGQFSLVVTFDNEDPAPNYSGYRIYIRFWNSSNPKTGGMYGEAGPFVLEGGVKPQKINVAGGNNLYTDKILQK